MDCQHGGARNRCLDLFDFDFMLVGSEMVGEKISNKPSNESLGKDWNQFPPLPQGPLGIPLPPSQDLLVLDKGLVTLLPSTTQIEE